MASRVTPSGWLQADSGNRVTPHGWVQVETEEEPPDENVFFANLLNEIERGSVMQTAAQLGGVLVE